MCFAQSWQGSRIRRWAGRPIVEAFPDGGQRGFAVFALNQPVDGGEKFETEGRLETIDTLGGPVQDGAQRTGLLLFEKEIRCGAMLFVEPDRVGRTRVTLCGPFLGG